MDFIKRYYTIKNRKLSIFIILLLGVNNICLSQVDTSFWFAPPEISADSYMDRPIILRLSALSLAANVTISLPANPSFAPINVIVPSLGTNSVDLTPWIDIIESKPANTVLNTGIHIQSSAKINVYYENVSGGYGLSCQCNPEIFALKGGSGLGTNFIISSQNVLSNWAYNPPSTHSFDIVASEDNTNITITPYKNIVGHASGIPFSITLNKGQVYSATATGSAGPDHLCGSTVTSNKPVAITMKDDGLFNYVCWDLGGDQLIPIDNLGTEYIAVQGFLDLGFQHEQVFITAVYNATKIYVGGVFYTSLNASQTISIPLTVPAIYITSDKKVYALQMSGSGCEVGISTLPSISCRGSSEVSYTRSSDAQLSLLLTTHTGNQSYFLLNGSPIAAVSFSVVPGTSNQYVCARIDIPTSLVPALSSLRVTNTKGLFHMGIIHGDGPSGGARFGYFSDYAYPKIDVLPDSLLVCGDSIIINAGSGYLQYNWNTGANTQTIVARLDRLYKITVTNTDGCTLSDSGFITFEKLKRDSSTVAICNGSTFTLPGGKVVTTAGNYDDTTYYKSGCDSLIKDVSVTLLPELIPSINITATSNNICKGENITFTAESTNGGVNPAFQWQVNGINTGTNSLTYSNNTLGNGDVITCIMTSYATCVTNPIDTSNKIDITVKSPLTPSVTIGCSANNICAGRIVTFNAKPTNEGSAPLYQWKVNGTNVGTNNSLYTNSNFRNNDVVNCTVISNERCITNAIAVSNNIIINVLPGVDASLTINSSSNSICMGSPVTFTANSVNGGNSPSYQWQVNGVNVGTGYASFTTSSLANGDVVSCIMSSSLKCALPVSSDNKITLPVEPVPKVSLGPDKEITMGGSIQLVPNIIGDIGSYLWSPSIGLDDVNIASPTASPVVTTLYKLDVTSVNGCTNGANITVKVINNEFGIPNVFTPNGDGLNDVFYIIGSKGVKIVKNLSVYNRWGELVFHKSNTPSDDPAFGWNGNYKGQPAEVATYVYIAEIITNNGKMQMLKGNITLIR